LASKAAPASGDDNIVAGWGLMLGRVATQKRATPTRIVPVINPIL
jgi:hypothetical protein